MITMRCNCGETYYAENAHAGHSICCRKCGKILQVKAHLLDTPSKGKKPAYRQTYPSKASGSSHTKFPKRKLFYGFIIAAALITTSLSAILAELSTHTPSSVTVSQPDSQPIHIDNDNLEKVLEQIYDQHTGEDQNLENPDSIVPSCSQVLVDRPTSSAELGGNYRGGLGEINIINGTDYDAVAVLVRNSDNLPKRAIYIRSNEKGLITQIPKGTYRIQFQLGEDFQIDRKFCEVASTSEFEHPFTLEELEWSDRTEYSIIKISLHPVFGGSARVHAIPESSFELPPL